MQRRTNYIEDLSSGDLAHLAQLLSYTPPTIPSSPLTPSQPEPPFPPSSFLASQSALLSPVSPQSSTPTSQSHKSPSEPFPPHLLRSTALLPRLALKLSPHLPFAAAQATLCSVHRPLNPYLIRRIFMQVCAESGLRVRGLAAGCEFEESKEQGQTREQQEAQEKEGSPGKVNPAVKTWLRRLRTLNSLWLSPALFRVLTGAQPHEERFSRVQSGCEACILAIVGGCATAICDLRAGMLGRKKSGRESKLWGLVEAWVDVVGTRADPDASTSDGEKEEQDGGEEHMMAEWIREESQRVGKLVMKERKRLRKVRRRERRERRYRGTKTGDGDGSPDAKNENQVEKNDEIVGGWDGAADNHHDSYEPAEEGEELGDIASAVRTQHQSNREAEDHDLEGSIIDFYRRIVSPRSTLAHQDQQSGYSRQSNDDTAPVDSFNEEEEDREKALHPAFRDSITYSPTSGTFHRRPQPTSKNNNNGNQGARSRFTYYTQSTYSQDDNGLAPLLRSRFGDDSSTGTPSVPPPPSSFVEKSFSSRNEQTQKQDERDIAEKRAQSYRNLVGSSNPFSVGIAAAEEASHGSTPYHQTNTKTSSTSASSLDSDSGKGVEAPEPSPPIEAIREYMRHLWLTRAEPDEEDDGVVGYMGILASGYDEFNSSSRRAADMSIDSNGTSNPFVYNNNRDTNSSSDSNSTPNPSINRAPPTRESNLRSAPTTTTPETRRVQQEVETGTEDEEGKDKSEWRGEEESRTQRRREKHLTTWSAMMKKGGANRWLGF